MSVPLNRIMLIRQERPRLASAAPKVRRIRMMDTLAEPITGKAEENKRMKERMRASRERSAINRCFRWEIMVRRADSLTMGRRV